MLEPERRQKSSRQLSHLTAQPPLSPSVYSLHSGRRKPTVPAAISPGGLKAAPRLSPCLRAWGRGTHCLRVQLPQQAAAPPLRP